jgi:hypothetical protein
MRQRMSFADGSGMLCGAASVPDIVVSVPTRTKTNGLDGLETGWPVKVPNIIWVILTLLALASS